MTPERLDTYQDFWRFYLSEHRRIWTQRLRIFGTGSAVILLFAGFVTGDWRLLLLAPAIAYGQARASHFCVEHNRPVTFRFPLWSLRADLSMFILAASGRLFTELSRQFDQE